MYAVPDVDAVVAVAKALGIHLGPDEAVLYRKYLMGQLGEFDTFVQARLEEPKPPMVSAARTPGYQPRPDEDPLNAWMWKCRVAGAADGLLAGKTVSYKDHIAVAGMPMRFGSFALEGFLPDFDATVVTRVLQEGGTIIGKNVMSGLSGGFGTGGASGLPPGGEGSGRWGARGPHTSPRPPVPQWGMQPTVSGVLSPVVPWCPVGRWCGSRRSAAGSGADRKNTRSLCAGISGAPRAGRPRPPEHTGPRAGAAPRGHRWGWTRAAGGGRGGPRQAWSGRRGREKAAGRGPQGMQGMQGMPHERKFSSSHDRFCRRPLAAPVRHCHVHV